MRRASVFVLIVTAVTVGSAAESSGVDTRDAPTKGPVSFVNAPQATLNSDLRRGGGVDDTDAMQRVLDRAKDGSAVHLLIDGPALVSGLNVYGNTTIECTEGGGFYLKDNSDRAILRNAHRSRGEVIDEHITVRGCFFNGNRQHQLRMSSKPLQERQEPDGTVKSGLQFLGVNYLTVENVTLWNIRSFGVLIANAKFIHISNLTVDSALPAYPGASSIAEQRKYLRSNIDGVHFNGPIQYLTINGLKLRTEDDALALNANDMDVDDMTATNDMGPYVGQGPITDVVVSNVVLMDALQGIRLLSSDQRIDRVVIQNVTGTVRHRMAILSHFIIPSHTGNFGSILFSTVNVQPERSATWSELYPDWYKHQSEWDINEEGELPLFSLNASIANLRLQGIMTQVIDGRPVIRVGRDSNIRTLSVDMDVDDPSMQAIPIKLMAGGHVDRLNFSLNWIGRSVDVGSRPIQYDGGTIAHLHWISTPPKYVGAAVTKSDPHVIIATFSQIVKQSDLLKGVEVRISGQVARVLDATQLGKGDTVRYRISPAATLQKTVTWAYDGAQGTIQNLDGDNMLSVSATSVSHTQ